MFRFQPDNRVDAIHVHASSRAGRQLAMETMERDRSAALAAVRYHVFFIVAIILCYVGRFFPYLDPL